MSRLLGGRPTRRILHRPPNKAHTAVFGIPAELLTGGLGADTLSGGLHDDTLSGGDSNDHLEGGSGNDSLMGDLGNDHLDGNDGNDTRAGRPPKGGRTMKPPKDDQPTLKDLGIKKSDSARWQKISIEANISYRAFHVKPTVRSKNGPRGSLVRACCGATRYMGRGLRR